MKAIQIQRSGFKKNNSNRAFPSMTEWRIHDNVYECEFDCMFSIRIYYVLILSRHGRWNSLFFIFCVVCVCEWVWVLSEIQHQMLSHWFNGCEHSSALPMFFMPYAMAHLQALNYYIYLYLNKPNTKKEAERRYMMLSNRNEDEWKKSEKDTGKKWL